jgi:DNA-binding response OmpR family regulator
VNDVEFLTGKRILIVDDEPDVLETLSELLDMCELDTALNFKDAARLLDENLYDMAVLDIMGVRGYDLLELANQKGIPAIMFTAHALNPDDFFKSIEGGAKAYIPKEKMSEIVLFTADLLRAHQEGTHKHGRWFGRLKSFFDKQFGPEWKEHYKHFWEKFELD